MRKLLDFIRGPLCNICNKPLELDVAVTDRDGKAVHEECYVLRLRLQDAWKLPKR